MKKLVFISMTVPALFMAACNESTVNADDDAHSYADNYVFQRSAELADETANSRSAEISDLFEVKTAWIEENEDGKVMHIKVNQARGCKEVYTEKFEVIWSGIMLMIYPPQIGFYLKLNTEACPVIEDNVEETITLDLVELFGPADFLEEAKFTIMNASRSTGENDVTVNPS
ncbi:MAG: hypothetical protein WD266_01210 [Balneolales bacterium]